MDTISIAGGACIAAALVVAILSLRERPAKMPCIYCGALLSPPDFRCNHILGDTQQRG